MVSEWAHYKLLTCHLFSAGSKGMQHADIFENGMQSNQCTHCAIDLDSSVPVCIRPVWLKSFKVSVPKEKHYILLQAHILQWGLIY